MAKLTTWICDCCKRAVQTPNEKLPEAWDTYNRTDVSDGKQETFQFCGTCLVRFRSPVRKAKLKIKRQRRAKPRVLKQRSEEAAADLQGMGVPRPRLGPPRPTPTTGKVEAGSVEIQVLEAINEGLDNYGAIMRKLSAGYGTVTHCVSRLATKGLVAKPKYGGAGFKITPDGLTALEKVKKAAEVEEGQGVGA